MSRFSLRRWLSAAEWLRAVLDGKLTEPESRGDVPKRAVFLFDNCCGQVKAAALIFGSRGWEGERPPTTDAFGFSNQRQRPRLDAGNGFTGIICPDGERRLELGDDTVALQEPWTWGRRVSSCFKCTFFQWALESTGDFLHRHFLVIPQEDPMDSILCWNLSTGHSTPGHISTLEDFASLLVQRGSISPMAAKGQTPGFLPTLCVYEKL